ncbi:MAG: acetylglutamate kinase [Cardiobacteriaceae bacterium]|nr:acetylglutamate kinase [Cardiobacteriaceae bacterium]
MQTLVIKYGGNAIDGHDALRAFAQAIRGASELGYRPVIVHGGGPQINHWLEKTGTPSHFVAGQRHTDQATLDIVEMALCAHVNKAIVRALHQSGLRTCGISGEDGAMLTAEHTPELGRVGQIRDVQPEIIYTLLDNGYLPVIAPLALDEHGNALNINADFSAAHIAASLAADHFILMTNVPGILDAEKQRIPHATPAQIDELITAGTIHGGMLPKVQCALMALRGAQRTTIIDGTDPANLLRLLEAPGSIGTSISS